MFSKRLQLVCILLGSSLTNLVAAQATATATENGIVSAAGGPESTQSVSYSIMGGGIMEPTSTFSITGIPTSRPTDASILNGSNSSLSSSNEHGLSVPAILGIVVAVVLAVVAIVSFTIFMHKRKKQTLSRAKRKSIMDAEFAASKTYLQHCAPPMSSINRSQTQNLGYFDLAKPLPVVIEEPRAESPSNDGLSCSSTIIADAGDMAQINRKVSLHQAGKKSREQQRDRNHALQVLVTNEDNQTTSLSNSPLASFPVTPREAHYSTTRGACHDGDGDSFAKRPSKI